MSTSIDLDAVREAYDDVRSDQSETLWYVQETKPSHLNLNMILLQGSV